MNIGIFTNTYKPTINGVVNCVALIRQGLMERGHKVYVFAPSFPGYNECEEGIFRFPSLNLLKSVKYPVCIPYCPAITDKIPSLNLDIIHSQHPFVMGDVAAQWARKLSIPLVFTFHTQYEQYAHYIPLPRGFVQWVSKTFVKAYTSKCDLIITPGDSIIELLHSYGIHDNVVFMANAIDLSNFASPDKVRIRSQYGIRDDEKLLVYVGRMAREKNLPFMLRAFSQIRQKNNTIRLMIIGEGPELEHLKSYAAELSLSESVIFPGRVEYHEIPAYYGAAQLFVMTSTTEVKPLALLEAMASGLPIVAVTAHGSSDTIIDNVNGFLTEEKESVFADRVVMLINDEARLKSMTESSRKTAGVYSLDTMSDTLLNHYGEAVERKRQLRISSVPSPSPGSSSAP
ncbi:MAG: glycosyltransferase family 4 protein [Vulcanimicrobiota bacterium]